MYFIYRYIGANIIRIYNVHIYQCMYMIYVFHIQVCIITDMDGGKTGAVLTTDLATDQGGKNQNHPSSRGIISFKK